MSDEKNRIAKEEYFAMMESLPFVCQSMRDALEHGRPWSLIRMGDGERMLLQSLRTGKAVGCVKDSGWLNRYIPTVHWKKAASELLEAVPRATYVGLSHRAFDNKNYAVHEELAKHGLDWRKLPITTAGIHVLLSKQPERIREISEGRKFGVVYWKPEYAEKKFAQIGVKVSAGYPYGHGADNDAALQYFGENRCDLVFLSGGPYGKALAVKLAEEHGTAVFDFGRGIELLSTKVENVAGRRKMRPKKTRAQLRSRRKA